MKKILGLGLLVLLFSCQKERGCKTCTTIGKYPGQEAILIQSTACGDVIDELDGKYIFAVNPTTGEILYYQMTTCK